ncbi:MAG: hypothetical protein HY707_03205, partial [Ignavibacteriae bacterium]|nr:hypothetical protein [Ignavibacteriota bacterium]
MINKATTLFVVLVLGVVFLFSEQVLAQADLQITQCCAADTDAAKACRDVIYTNQPWHIKFTVVNKGPSIPSVWSFGILLTNQTTGEQRIVKDQVDTLQQLPPQQPVEINWPGSVFADTDKGTWQLNIVVRSKDPNNRDPNPQNDTCITKFRVENKPVEPVTDIGIQFCCVADTFKNCGTVVYTNQPWHVLFGVVNKGQKAIIDWSFDIFLTNQLTGVQTVLKQQVPGDASLAPGAKFTVNWTDNPFFTEFDKGPWQIDIKVAVKDSGNPDIDQSNNFCSTKFQVENKPTGQCRAFFDQVEFVHFNVSHGKKIKGIETFEEAVIDSFGKNCFPDPLGPNPNKNFPNGLEQGNILIQTNITPGPNPPDPNPSTDDCALFVIGPGFIGSNSKKVGEDLFLFNQQASLDLIFTEPNHTGVGFWLSRFDGFPTGGWHITVYDKANQVMGKFDVPSPPANEPTKTFFGVWCEKTIGRINIFDDARDSVGNLVPAPDAIDDIEMWRENPPTFKECPVVSGPHPAPDNAGFPVAIAYNKAHNELWMVDKGGTILRLDPLSKSLIGKIPVQPVKPGAGVKPDGLAFTDHNRIFYTNHDGDFFNIDDHIVEIDKEGNNLNYWVLSNSDCPATCSPSSQAPDDPPQDIDEVFGIATRGEIGPHGGIIVYVTSNLFQGPGTGIIHILELTKEQHPESNGKIWYSLAKKGTPDGLPGAEIDWDNLHQNFWLITGSLLGTPRVWQLDQQLQPCPWDEVQAVCVPLGSPTGITRNEALGDDNVLEIVDPFQRQQWRIQGQKGNCGPEIDHFTVSLAVIALEYPDGNSETVFLSGPTTVEVQVGKQGQAADTDGDGLDQVTTEIVRLQLTGTSSKVGPITVQLDPRRPSLGEIEEQVNNTPGVLDLPPFTATGSANSFFDVFFEVKTGIGALYGKTPVKMQSKITHKPPAPGETYQNLTAQSIELNDADGNPTGIRLIHARHMPNPEPEIDEFSVSLAVISLAYPDGNNETVFLSGPTTVKVQVPPNGQAADTDGDGLEQVQAEIVSLSLTGTSSKVGPLKVQLDPNRPSLGEIEEQANNTPGVLDIPPFTATGSANSFFDVFFSVKTEIGTLYGKTPLRMQSKITHKPPAPGETYQNLTGQVVELNDERGNPTGIRLTHAGHTPNPGRVTDLGVEFVCVTDSFKQCTHVVYTNQPWHALFTVVNKGQKPINLWSFDIHLGRLGEFRPVKTQVDMDVPLLPGQAYSMNWEDLPYFTGDMKGLWNLILTVKVKDPDNPDTNLHNNRAVWQFEVVNKGPISDIGVQAFCVTDSSKQCSDVVYTKQPWHLYVEVVNKGEKKIDNWIGYIGAHSQSGASGYVYKTFTGGPIQPDQKQIYNFPMDFLSQDQIGPWIAYVKVDVHDPTNPDAFHENNFARYKFQVVNKGNENYCDLSIYLGGTVARPGFQKWYYLWYYNTGTKKADATVVFTLPSNVNYKTSSDGGVYNSSNNTVTWNMTGIQPGGYGYLTVEVQVKLVPLGTELKSSATIDGCPTDLTPSNNSATTWQIVVGSYDPNDKAASIAEDSAPYQVLSTPAPYLIQNTDRLAYKVRFQNTGTDTAFNIVVRDT